MIVWRLAQNFVSHPSPPEGNEKGFQQKKPTKFCARCISCLTLNSNKTFQKFSKLREIRKKIAAEEGISAFIVLTGFQYVGPNYGFAPLIIVFCQKMAGIFCEMAGTYYPRALKPQNAKRYISNVKVALIRQP